MSEEKPKLISFKLCPFVQRSVIALEQKYIEYDIEFIDLANKPDWFLKISPFGKVPVLLVGKIPLFESSAINEYLDEVYGPHLHPSDPILKAINRAWMETISVMLMTQWRYYTVKEAEAFEKIQQDVVQQLTRLNAAMTRRPFFNGEDLSLLDTAIAPLLMRYQIFEQLHSTNLLDGLSRVKAWTKALLTLDSVKKSMVPGFEELLVESIHKSEGHFSTLIS